MKSRIRQLFRGSWTDKKARTATLRILGEINDRLIEIGGLWGDEDQWIVDQADEYMEDFVRLKVQFQEYWKERDEERRAGETA